MQNILLVSPYPPPYGGIANWTKMIVEHMKDPAVGVQLHLVNTAPKRRATEGRGILERIVGGGTAMLGIRAEVAKILKNEKIDCIHLVTSGSLAVIRDLLIMLLAKQKKIPVVYHLRFGRVPDICKAETREWKMIKKAMQLSACVISLDKRTADTVKTALPEVNSLQMPNPFNMANVRNVNCEKTQADTVVFVGWVVPTKGIGELVGAWKKLCTEYPDKKLKIIGPYKEEYVASLQCKDVQNLTFAGEMPHDEVLAEVARSGLFVLPSYTEGFPNAVVEAMALGTPVAASDVGAIGEMLADDCGIVFEAESEQAVYDALKTAFDDSGKTAVFAHNAKKKTQEQYALEKVVEKYKQLWSEVTV